MASQGATEVLTNAVNSDVKTWMRLKSYLPHSFIQAKQISLSLIKEIQKLSAKIKTWP